jgi:FtsP/CotA-like multicopper oxidase with cupredoxin domain
MISRRQFLALAGTGTVGLMGGSSLVRASEMFSSRIQRTDSVLPDLEVELRALPIEVPILPGPTTMVYRYEGKVLRGPSESLVTDNETYLGPTFHVRRGQHIRIRFTNELDAPSIIHWHGLHVPDDMDGHPRFAVEKGESYLYDFVVNNRAGTYWYHPHPHGLTGFQVYGGLAGLFIVHDDEEEAAGLPGPERDTPVVIQDRVFDTDNSLVYLSGGMVDRMTGTFGDRILVNGKPDFVLKASSRVYRLRVLNGSNARVYRLAWDDGSPLVIIGTDGGLLEKPVQKRYVMLGPAERIEIWADFSRYTIDNGPSLVSLPVPGGAFCGGMTRRRQCRFDEGIFPVMRVHVDREEKETLRLPSHLSQIKPLIPELAVNHRSPKEFHLTMNHMLGLINGRRFEMEGVSEEETVDLGSYEVWNFINHRQNMGMMGMTTFPHPVHLHGQPFRIIRRGAHDPSGYVDEGWKDTALLMPGENVSLLVGFKDYPGLFLYHCHNLEHEDAGMMRNYMVRETTSLKNKYRDGVV